MQARFTETLLKDMAQVPFQADRIFSQAESGRPKTEVLALLQQRHPSAAGLHFVEDKLGTLNKVGPSVTGWMAVVRVAALTMIWSLGMWTWAARYTVLAEMLWLPSSLDSVPHPEPFIALAESTKKLRQVQNQQGLLLIRAAGGGKVGAFCVPAECCRRIIQCVQSCTALMPCKSFGSP